MNGAAHIAVQNGGIYWTLKSLNWLKFAALLKMLSEPHL